jgi:hypothetical protein
LPFAAVVTVGKRPGAILKALARVPRAMLGAVGRSLQFKDFLGASAFPSLAQPSPRVRVVFPFELCIAVPLPMVKQRNQ